MSDHGADFRFGLSPADTKDVDDRVERARHDYVVKYCRDRGWPENPGKLEPWQIEQIQNEPEWQTPPLPRHHEPSLDTALVCTRCGSLVDYGRKMSRGHDRRCGWCPACTPGMPWKYGKVIDESSEAERIREKDASQ